MSASGVKRRFGAGWFERRAAAPATGPAPEGWSPTSGWREFFDLLSEAIVVLAADGRVRFANTEALRLVPQCAAGASIAEIRGGIGKAASDWLGAALAVQASSDTSPSPSSKLGPPPDARLADGRTARLDWRRLDGARSVLRLVPEAVAVSPPAAAAIDRALPLKPTLESLDFLWDSPFPTTLQGADFRLIDVNPAFVALIGHPREALIGRDPNDFRPPRDRARSETRRRVASRAAPAPALATEGSLIDAGGRERRFRIARRLLRDEHGRIYHLGLLQDTTAEHSARERADRSLRELDDWFELSPAGMVLFDEHGVLLRHNAALAELTGAPPSTLAEADAGLAGLLGWDAATGMPALDPAAPPLVRHATVALPGGQRRALRAVLRCYRTAGGQRRTMAVVEDHSAEEASELAQVQIGALMDAAGVGLATFQESSGWMRLNPGHAADSGAARASALQSIGRDLVVPESIAEFEVLQAALRDARRAQVRYAIRHPELGLRWLLTRVEPATLASGTRTTSVVTLDITEQHETQQRTEQLLRELGMILESTAAGIAYLRDGVLVRCNRRFETMLGFIAGSAEGRPIDAIFAEVAPAADLAAAARRQLAAEGVFEAEIEATRDRGAGAEPRWYSLSLRGEGDVQRVGEAVAVLTDISRLKAQQREFEVLARDRELMFSFTDVGVAMVRDGRIQRANEALARLTGQEVDRLAGQPHGLLFDQEPEHARITAIAQASLAEHGQWSGERQLRARDGRTRWVQVTKRLLVPDDVAAGMIVSYVDVDARHRAVRAIAQQAERTRAILDSALVGIVTVGVDGIEWMNRSARRMFGGEFEEFAGQPIATVATPEPDHPFRRDRVHEPVVDGRPETFECRLRARDGRDFWVVGNVVATGAEAGAAQWTYALLDIEQRREAEARVAAARAQLQRIIEAAPLAITLRDASTLALLQVNDVAARSLSAAPAQLVGRTPEELYSPQRAALRRADMVAALASPEPLRCEYRIEAHGAAQIWDVRYLPLAVRPGAPPDQLLLVATDVTEQRATQEARFEAEIAQREMLVKEVHHRIKNNLQGVAGLLQQIGQKKPEVAGPIAEVVGQVQAIAQVYGLQVGAEGPLGLVGVVQAIAASVQRTFGRAIEVTVEGTTAAEWSLPEAESIPIALSLNELLTNALKHSPTAAGDGPAGGDAVQCQLVCAAGEAEIRIRNRGRLAPGFDLARIPGGVSGLGLVRALLPRRSAVLTLAPTAEGVEACVVLRPPGIQRTSAAAADSPTIRA